MFLTITSFGQKEKDTAAIIIPNVITPNSETNYIFLPTGIPSDWELFIFNRWGELIFEGSNKGWDGTYKNVKQPADVYIYKLKYSTSQEKKTLTGHVTLIR